MPQINWTRDLCHGEGGIAVWFNGVQLDGGSGGVRFLDDRRLIYQRGETVVIYDIETGAKVPADTPPRGASRIETNRAGVWAAWLADASYATRTSKGTSRNNTYLYSVGSDDTLLIKSYPTDGPPQLVDLDFKVIHTFALPAIEATHLDAYTVLYKAHDGRVFFNDVLLTLNEPTPYGLQLFRDPDGLTYVTMNNEIGTVQLIGTPRGFRFGTKGATFYPQMTGRPDQYVAAWSTDQGDQAVQTVEFTHNDLAPPPDPVPPNPPDPVPPDPPDPEPEGDPMLTYGQVLTDFEPTRCTLEDHPDAGFKAVKKADGTYLSITYD